MRLEGRRQEIEAELEALAAEEEADLAELDAIDADENMSESQKTAERKRIEAK
jgi:hypothetical protein